MTKETVKKTCDGCSCDVSVVYDRKSKCCDIFYVMEYVDCVPFVTEITKMREESEILLCDECDSSLGIKNQIENNLLDYEISRLSSESFELYDKSISMLKRIMELGEMKHQNI